MAGRSPGGRTFPSERSPRSADSAGSPPRLGSRSLRSAARRARGEARAATAQSTLSRAWPGRRTRLRWTVLSAPGPRAVRGPRSIAGGLAGRRIGRLPVRPVLKHGPRSLTCARVAGQVEARGRNEGEGSPLGGPRRDPGTLAEGRAHRRPVSSASTVRRSKSVHVGTRKMVNYA